MPTENKEEPKVWIYGKAEPGWYVAATIASKQFADDMEVAGYQVRRQYNKPVE